MEEWSETKKNLLRNPHEVLYYIMLLNLHRALSLTGLIPTKIFRNIASVKLHGPYRAIFSGNLICIYSVCNGTEDSQRLCSYTLRVNVTVNCKTKIS